MSSMGGCPGSSISMMNSSPAVSRGSNARRLIVISDRLTGREIGALALGPAGGPGIHWFRRDLLIEVHGDPLVLIEIADTRTRACQREGGDPRYVPECEHQQIDGIRGLVRESCYRTVDDHRDIGMLKRFQAGDGSGKAEDTRLHPVQTPADGVDVPLNRSKLPPDLCQLVPELGVSVRRLSHLLGFGGGLRSDADADEQRDEPQNGQRQQTSAAGELLDGPLSHHCPGEPYDAYGKCQEAENDQ